MGVFFFGLKYTGVELIARKAGVVGNDLVAKWPAFTGRYVIFNFPGPNQVPTIKSVELIPAAHPHFPYGWNVDPD